MRQFSKERLVAGMIAALFCFLVLAASILSHQQKNRVRNNTLRDIQGDLELMSSASLEALLKSDYVAVRNFIEQWGSTRKEYHELRVTAANGFVIAEYINPEAPSGETFSLSREVLMGKTKLATIRLLGDYSDTDKVITAIRRKLVLVASIFTTLLGAALWLLFRNMAIVPLEDVVNRRTEALLEANQELEQLTNNSPT